MGSDKYAASKISYPSDEEVNRADRLAEEAARVKECEWDKVTQDNLVKLRVGSITLQSSTPEHERGLFASQEDGSQEDESLRVRADRSWSPEPKQKGGIIPCPYRPGTPISQIRGCWMDPNCTTYSKKSPKNFCAFRKHLLHPTHGHVTECGQWTYGWTNSWVDAMGREEYRVAMNGIDPDEATKTTATDLQVAAEVSAKLKRAMEKAKLEGKSPPPAKKGKCEGYAEISCSSITHTQHRSTTCT